MNVYIVTECWWETADPMADTCGESVVAVFDRPEKAGRFVRTAIEKEIAEDDRGAYFIDNKPITVDESVVGRIVHFHEYAGRRRAYKCLAFEVQ